MDRVPSAGVVNFVLDKGFDGFKGVVQGGISWLWRCEVASGSAWRADKGYSIASMRYGASNITIVRAFRIRRRRPYGDPATSIVGSGSAAVPYRLVSGVRRSDASYGGLAASGPFSRPAVRRGWRTGALQAGHASRLRVASPLVVTAGCGTAMVSCCRSSIQPRRSGGSDYEFHPGHDAGYLLLELWRRPAAMRPIRPSPSTASFLSHHHL